MIPKLIIILILCILIYIFYDAINWNTIQILFVILLFILYSYRYYTTSKILYFILIVILYCITLYLIYSNHYFNITSAQTPWYIIALIASVFLLIGGIMFTQYRYISICAFVLILFVLFMNYFFKYITNFFIYITDPNLSYRPFYISLIIIACLIAIYLLYKFKGNANSFIQFITLHGSQVYDYIRTLYIHYLVEYQSSEDYDVIITIASIIVLILILFYKQLYHYFIHLNKGVYLINHPVTLSEETELNYKPEFKYKYAISLWIWFNSVHSNNHTVPILNYGDCPLIEYNPQTNKMNIVFLNENKIKTKIVSSSVQLQKWNNIVINYVGGTVDVFINGSLIKTVNNVIPVKSVKNITVGSSDGISGGLSNLMYFKEPLTLYQLNEIYSYTPKY